MGIRSWIWFGVIIVICVALLSANALYCGPRRERLAELTRELAVAEQEFAYLSGNVEDFERIRDFLPAEVEGEGEGAQRFLSMVSTELERVGMVLDEVEPKRVTPQGVYTRREYKLNVEGNYRQLANFLRYLETRPEVVLVEAFSWQSRALREHRRDRGSITVAVIGY